jgi:O-methyltransferase involved in polyketide biosynthesis
VDTTKAHPARVYDYWLDGKDNFAVDRHFADAITDRFPWVKTAARSNRDFRVRAVRAVAEQGVRQFLDIGTGLPAPGNTHTVAQQVAPQARVLYVDNDPLVMTHSRALMVGTPEGRTEYVEEDLRSPENILRAAVHTGALDLRQPVCLVLAAVLHFIPDLDEAQQVVRTLLNAVPPGSYLIISHGTPDFVSAQDAAEYERMYAAGEAAARTRTKKDIETFFDGLDVLTPGFVAVSDWRPEDSAGDRPTPEQVSLYGAVGRIG